MSSSEIILLPAELISKLSSDKAFEDGFEVENLISTERPTSSNRLAFPKFGSGNQKRNSGFMAATFAKAPVILTWHFQRPIMLHAIHLGLAVGNQRTTAVEVFVGDDAGGDRIQRRVGSAYFSNTNSPDQCIIRRRNRGVELTSILEEESAKDTVVVYFTKTHLLENVKTLVVKIAQSYYIPCLAFAKIFVQKTEDMNIPHMFPIKEACPETSSKCDALLLESPKIDETTIPNEFFDPLTHSCMSLPIILPSGHTIDRSTLERYLEEEARFGRSANDPFTNVRFTESSFPIPNGRLKERIDRFFLIHPNLAKEQNFGRTLCGGDKFAAFTQSGHGADGARAKKRKRPEPEFCGKLETKRKPMERKSDVISDTPEYARNLLSDMPSFL